MDAVNAVQRERGTAEMYEDRGGVEVLNRAPPSLVCIWCRNRTGGRRS